MALRINTGVLYTLSLWENVLTLLHRNPVRQLPAPVLAFVLLRLFLALDYLHTQCNIVHTGWYYPTRPPGFMMY